MNKEIFDDQIGVLAKKYYDELYRKIPQLIKACSFPDELPVTVKLSNDDECIYTLDDLKRGLKRCSPINSIIFHLNKNKYLFPIYGRYVSKYNRLKYIKKFCTGRNIMVKMKWSCVGLSREGPYKVKWSKVSFKTYLERIDSMIFFCEPIYLWEITELISRWKRSNPGRPILVKEIFHYLEDLDSFKSKLSILSKEIVNFVPDSLFKVVIPDESITYRI